MNVYDTVNKLAGEIKESEEYKNFKIAKQKISEEPKYKEKIAEFEKLRYEEQINSIKSGKNDASKMEKIKNYFDTELKFNILLGDVNKVISDAVKDVIS